MNVTVNRMIEYNGAWRPEAMHYARYEVDIRIFRRYCVSTLSEAL